MRRRKRSQLTDLTSDKSSEAESEKLNDDMLAQLEEGMPKVKKRRSHRLRKKNQQKEEYTEQQSSDKHDTEPSEDDSKRHDDLEDRLKHLDPSIVKKINQSSEKSIDELDLTGDLLMKKISESPRPKSNFHWDLAEDLLLIKVMQEIVAEPSKYGVSLVTGFTDKQSTPIVNEYNKQLVKKYPTSERTRTNLALKRRVEKLTDQSNKDSKDDHLSFCYQSLSAVVGKFVEASVKSASNSCMFFYYYYFNVYFFISLLRAL